MTPVEDDTDDMPLPADLAFALFADMQALRDEVAAMRDQIAWAYQTLLLTDVPPPTNAVH